jgi:hypothetical protein
MEYRIIELSPEVVEQLDDQGYTYFLSKEAIEVEDNLIISLLPIKYNPEDKPLPVEFDGWYNLHEQGYEMARGVETILFLVIEDEEGILLE